MDKPRLSSRLALLLLLLAISPIGMLAGQPAHQSAQERTSRYPAITATLSGHVVNAETGERLPGANVFLTETDIGTAANIDGYFVFPQLSPGEYILKITYVGFKPAMDTVALEAGENLKRDYELLPSPIELESLEVSGERMEQQVDNQISRVRFGARQLRGVPQVGEADLMRTLQSLPGVLSATEFSTGLIVRGGNTDQNLILLDGVTVYNPSHLFGLFSNFILDAVKEAELTKGGFNAEYGGRLSAVLNVRSKEGNQKQFHTKALVSLISAQTTLEGPLDKGAWLLAARSTTFDKIFDPATFNFPYSFSEVQGHVFQDMTENDRLSLTWYTSRDELAFTDSDLSASWGNRVVSINYRKIENSRLISNWTIGTSRFDTQFKLGGISNQLISDNWIDDQFSLGLFSGTSSENAIGDITFGTDWTYYISQTAQLHSGAHLKRFSFYYNNDYLGNRLYNVSQLNIELSAYSSLKKWLTPRMMIEPGVRVNYYDLHQQWYWDPRFQMKLLLTQHRFINAAVGLYHQYVETVQDDFNPSLLNQWFTVDASLEPASSIQYILGYEEYFGGKYRIQVEGYYKTLENMLTFIEQRTTGDEALPSENLADLVEITSGYAYGFEFFLRKERGRFKGWLAYTYSVARKQIQEKDYFTNWDRTHALHIVGSYNPTPKWDISLKWTYQTGQPFTPILGYYTETLPNSGVPTYRTLPGDRNSVRYPEYHRMDLGVFRHFSLKKVRMDVFFQVINAYMQENVYRTYYLFGHASNGVDDDGDGEIDESDESIPRKKTILSFPLLPSIGIAIEL
ncbi:carboxypeptidase-like regulatory domain-containing protein [Candidatus Neomarinimicrobiota bacterium]